MNKTFAACLLAAASTLGLVQAATAATGNERLAALDTDGDKAINRQEAAANPKLAKNFDAIDANHDGKLDPGEIKTYAKAHKGGAAMNKLDTNGDGMLSREEAAGNKRLMANWDMIDTNKDGRISPDELKAARGK